MLGNRVEKKRKRYKNPKFLKALGWHCRALRVMKGYSIAQVAKTGKSLSAGTIDRLERGLADVQITVIVRYAKALGVSVEDLMQFAEAKE